MAKKIELKTEKLGEQEFVYVNQLISIISMGVGGEAMSAKEMFEAQPIVTKLKDHEDADAIVLEDAEWRFIRDRIEGAKYPVLHDCWIRFITAVRDAETVKIAEVAKEA